MSQNLENQITDAAASPKSSAVEGVVTTDRDLRELIAADEYLKSVAASKRKKSGIKFSRLVPPGTVQ